MTSKSTEQRHLAMIRAVTNYLDHTTEAMRAGDQDAASAAIHNFPTEAVPTLVMIAATNQQHMQDMADELDSYREAQQ